MNNYISDVSLYKKLLQFGGKNFDGQWIWRGGAVVANISTLAVNGTTTIDMSSLLENDGYDYEVILNVAFWTPSSSTKGQNVALHLYPSGTSGIYGGRVVSPTSSASWIKNNYFMVIKGNNRTLGIKNVGNQAAENVTITLHAQRRVSTYKYSPLISAINVNNENIPIGGKNFDGQWISKYSVLFTNISLAANASTTVNLSSYLPNDGYDYEVLFNSLTDYPNTSNGKQLSATLETVVPERAIQVSGTLQVQMGGMYVRGAVVAGVVSTTIIPVFASNKTVTFRNLGGATSTSNYLHAVGYRRIGTNI